MNAMPEPASPQADRGRAARLLEPIAGKLAATEALMRAKLGSDVPFVENAGRYLFEAGGKRMRPALLLLSARLLERDSDEEVTYAALVEFIHAASLVHDDIIDHSELRRGRRTAHAVWGSNLTVLLGDWLYTTAMRMGGSAPRTSGPPSTSTSSSARPPPSSPPPARRPL
jgi:octaprenyl-diphosphate synthase